MKKIVVRDSVAVGRWVSGLLLAGALGCSSNTVSSADDARRAYIGLDGSVGKSIDLGFAGFNQAQSANIPTESTSGDHGGTLKVTGQVDQGASANKQMRLLLAMARYSDVQGFTYDTDLTGDAAAPPPALDMSLQGIPSGTLTGTLQGAFRMSGDLSGPVTLNLMFSGDLQPAAADAGTGGGVTRKPGTTHVTGTATSPAGTFKVDVTE
jgi:hypothetical protein